MLMGSEYQYQHQQQQQQQQNENIDDNYNKGCNTAEDESTLAAPTDHFQLIDKARRCPHASAA